MQTPESLSPNGQPGGAANPGQDPGSNNGLRTGGIPAELDDRIAAVDPTLAQDVRSLIAEKSAEVTKNQMRLMEDTRLADEVRRLTQQDPDFDQYLDAKRRQGMGDSDALAGYHRKRLEQMGAPLQSMPLPTSTPPPASVATPDSLSESPLGATVNAPGAAPNVSEAKIRELEERLQQTQQEARSASDAIRNERLMEEARHWRDNTPDWQSMLPLVEKVKREHPSLSLTEADTLARQRFDVGASQAPTGGGDQQAPQTQPQPAGDAPPPPPVSAAANDLVTRRPEDKVYSKQIGRGLHEAMQDALRDTGAHIPP